MDRKRVFVFLVLGILALSFVVQIANFVSAQTVGEKILGNLGVDSTNLKASLTGISFAKFLFFLLVALIIYGIGDFLPFIGKKPSVNTGIAIIIAYLSTMYLSNEEIYSVLLSYSALGIILTGMVPFFVIAAIQYKAYEGGYHFASKLLWIVFIIVLAIKFFTANSNEIGKFGQWAYFLLAFASLGLFIWESSLFKLLVKDRVKEGIARYAIKTKASREKTDVDYHAVVDSDAYDKAI